MSGASAGGDRLLYAGGDVARLARDLEGARRLLGAPLDGDVGAIERSLAQLVLALVDLLRRLMERETLRRMEHGTITAAEIDALGGTFMRADARIEKLVVELGLERSDLSLNLGPLGDLL